MTDLLKKFIKTPKIDIEINRQMKKPENIGLMDAAQQLALRTNTTSMKAVKTLIAYGNSTECSDEYSEVKDIIKTHLPEMGVKELQTSIKKFSESFETKKLKKSSNKIKRKAPKAVRLAKKINEINKKRGMFGYNVSARVVNRNHVHIGVAHKSIGLQHMKYDKGRVHSMILRVLSQNPELKEGLRITVQHPTERGYATIGQAVML